MHPAYSVIAFTTVSGAGYGLLFWVSAAHLLGTLPDGRWFGFAALALALALATFGLLASLYHLGHPERAFRSFSQWRSSWLSREGVAALATYVPSGLLALIWLFGASSSAEYLLAFLAAASAGATVYCTGMIYASLRTIRQWNLGIVPINYLAISCATGLILLCFVISNVEPVPDWAAWCAVASLAAGAALKAWYWSVIDRDAGEYTAEMAVGLGQLGKVRQLEQPHTMPNFVMREMGYSIGRKHSRKLRRSALVSLFAAPAALTLASMMVGYDAIFFGLAVICASLGVLIERWLFFAEAEHVSQLYYGRSRA